VSRARRILVLAGLCLVLAPSAAAAQPLRLGFTDGLFTGDAELGAWLDRATSEGASFVRLDSSWASIAPRRPQAPTDPADPAYDWAKLDAAVRSATAHRLEVVLLLTGAPTWAEGSDRPADAPWGSWRPDAAAYGQFAQAVARRYSGTYAGLPRVRSFEPWDEPNLSKYLSPQWVRTARGHRAESPVIYRRLLNAFYRGAKAVQPDATIVAGATAPFGDPDPGGDRIMPVRFTRSLLCLDERLERSGACPDPARFDTFDHHPYSVRGPDAPALNADDVSVPDMAKLGRVIRAATRAGTALPRSPKPLWALEVSWDSSPPDPEGVPAAEHARWLEGALYRLWRQDVDTIAWFLIRDSAPQPSYATSYQSGVFLRDGTPKPAATAFRFPFVVERVSSTAVRLWGRAPFAGAVRIERRAGAGWRRVLSVRPGSDRVFFEPMRLRGAHALRAVQQAETSLSWPTPAR
jgi:hypothetical protein